MVLTTIINYHFIITQLWLIIKLRGTHTIKQILTNDIIYYLIIYIF